MHMPDPTHHITFNIHSSNTHFAFIRRTFISIHNCPHTPNVHSNVHAIDPSILIRPNYTLSTTVYIDPISTSFFDSDSVFNLLTCFIILPLTHPIGFCLNVRHSGFILNQRQSSFLCLLFR
eukprot:442389_1